MFEIFLFGRIFFSLEHQKKIGRVDLKKVEGVGFDDINMSKSRPYVGKPTVNKP